MKTVVYLSTLTSTYILVLFYVCSIAESQLVLLTDTQPTSNDVAKLQQSNGVGWLLLKPSVSKVAEDNLKTSSLQSLSMKAFNPKTYDSGHHYVVRVRRRVRIPPLPRIGYRHRRRVVRDVTNIDDGQLTTSSENSPMSYQIPLPTLHNHMTAKNAGDDRSSLSVTRQFLVNEQNRLLGSPKWTRAAPLPRIGRRLVDSSNSALFREDSLAAPLESEQQDDHVTSAVSDAISAARRAMPLPRIGFEARAAPLPRIGLRAAASAVAKRVLLRPMLEASRRAAPLPRIG